MNVKVHVLGFKGSAAVEAGEEATAMLHGILEIDGVLIEEVGQIEVFFGGQEIVTVKACMTPGAFEVVSHDDRSWPALLAQIESERMRRAGSGRLVASI